MLRQVYLGHMLLLEVLLLLAALPFLEEVCYGFVAGVWEAELLAAGGSSGLYRISQGDEVDVHCAQYFVNSSHAPVLLFRRRLKSMSDVLKGFGVRVLLSLGGMLFCVIGRLFVVIARVVPFSHFIPGIVGFLLIFMASTGGFLIPLRC